MTRASHAPLTAAFLLLAGLVLVSPLAAAEIQEVTDFGSNPGNLRMYSYVPEGLPESPPLVVVLHGCKQQARTYASDTGWPGCADRWKFILLLPEQKDENKRSAGYQYCFNWFDSKDNERDHGEALSIWQMIQKMKATHPINPRRVYVTGLSAGGAMTAVMLATYPEEFAGGAIIAGLPYKCVNVPDNPLKPTENQEAAPTNGQAAPTNGQAAPANGQAAPTNGQAAAAPTNCSCMAEAAATDKAAIFSMLDLEVSKAMQGLITHTPAEWGDLVRKAANYSGPRPRVSIWHSADDFAVKPPNGQELLEQWTNVDGIDQTPEIQENMGKHVHRVYDDNQGHPMVEFYELHGIGHGTPVDPGTGETQGGHTSQFVFDADIFSSYWIAKFWGLDKAEAPH